MIQDDLSKDSRQHSFGEAGRDGLYLMTRALLASLVSCRIRGGCAPTRTRHRMSCERIQAVQDVCIVSPATLLCERLLCEPGSPDR